MTKYSSVPVKATTYRRLKKLQLLMVKKTDNLKYSLDSLINEMADHWEKLEGNFQTVKDSVKG